MTFAIKKINQRNDLLPHLKLGFHIRDSGDNIPASLKASLLLVNGQPERGPGSKSVNRDKDLETGSDSNFGCSDVHKAVSPVIIGDAGSGVSMALLRNLGSFHIPLVRLSDFFVVIIEYVFCHVKLGFCFCWIVKSPDCKLV